MPNIYNSLVSFTIKYVKIEARSCRLAVGPFPERGGDAYGYMAGVTYLRTVNCRGYFFVFNT